MRVLWFTNIPMPTVDRRTGIATPGSGHWMSCLLDALAATGELKLAVVTAYPGRADELFSDGGVDYVVIGQPRWRSIFAHDQGDLRKCAEIVRRWKPDILHVHGTERFFGLLGARGLVDVPVLISIQGLIRPLLPWMLERRESGAIRRTVELIRRKGPLGSDQTLQMAADREREIIRGNHAFAGRTMWDLANIRLLNPCARYYRVGELLRSEFHGPAWKIHTCERFRVVFTNFGDPRRGTETLLSAVAALKPEFPTLRLALAGGSGGGYAVRVRERARDLGLSENLELLGYLSAFELARELRRSHVFCIASFLENSPNSLCEAMLVGMPCIASYTGGIPSLIEDGKTGVFFPSGDSALLAERLRHLFLDDAFAERLGGAARAEATARHSTETVVQQALNAYSMILEAAGTQG